MTARKLVYYGLVVSPSLLLGFIGLGARAYQESYDFEHFTKGQDDCTRFYVELVKAANSLPPVRDDQQSIAASRQIGQKWSDAVLSSRARTIPVLDVDQSTSWVVCEEITSAKARVSWSLWRTAQASIEKRDYDQAARDLSTSYVVNQATKGMNLFTIMQACKRQELVLNRLTEISPYISRNVRSDIKNLVARVRHLDGETSASLRRVKASLKIESLESESQITDELDKVAYWTRLYGNSERSVQNLEKKWRVFCDAALSQATAIGPMPSELVYRHELKMPQNNYRPFYAGRFPPHGYMVAYRSH